MTFFPTHKARPPSWFSAAPKFSLFALVFIISILVSCCIVVRGEELSANAQVESNDLASLQFQLQRKDDKIHDLISQLDNLRSGPFSDAPPGGVNLFADTTSNNATKCPSQEELCATPPIDWTDPIIYLKLAGTVFLVLLSGFCAGETTALMGLDLNTLTIVAKSDPKKRNRIYAARIIPVRRNGNLLLITLIIANVFVNSAISILSADLTSGLLGFFLSSALIVLFGEILPQALCVKYTLPIAANTVWVIYIFMFFLFPITYPLSLLLNLLLGQEMGQYFTKAGLKELISMHAQEKHVTGLEMDSANILHGALDFAQKKVKDIMTPLQHCYFLEVSAKVDADLLNDMWSHGHSRVPIYKETKDNVVGILHVKDLIVLNHEDELPLSTVLLFYGKEAVRVDPEMELSQLLALFKSGRGHLAVVQEPTVVEEGKDPVYKTVGLVTLEDVIEEILREEIIDESDRYVSNLHEERIERDNLMMNMRMRNSKRLTPNQIQTISHFLQKTSKYFQMLPPDYLKQMLGKSRLSTYKPDSGKDIYLYRKGEEIQYCSLLISGRVEIITSSEGFTTYLGPWSMIGVRGITDQVYVSDFDAKIIEDTVVLRIFKADFTSEVKDLYEQDSNFHLPQELDWISEGFALAFAGDSPSVSETNSTPLFVLEEETSNRDERSSSDSKRKPRLSTDSANGGLLRPSTPTGRKSGLSQLKSIDSSRSPPTPRMKGEKTLHSPVEEEDITLFDKDEKKDEDPAEEAK